MFNVILFSLIGGLFSVLWVSFLFRAEKRATKLVEYATPFAAGVLLAAAFTNLIPEALESDNTTRSVMTAVLVGVLLFFMLERFLRFFHHHHEHDGHNRAPSSLIIIGDTLHNALDGIAIGAAFLIDVPTGIIAATAVALHEIPQEIGDFGLLLRNGMAKSKVVIVNIVSALATTVTAVLTFAIGDKDSFSVAFLLAITAGFFIYIATSDIIPEIHEKSAGKKDIRPWLLLLGALFILVVSPIAHKYIDAGHGHDDSSEVDTHINGEDAHEDDDHYDDDLEHDAS
jgi:zinc and cadmium transporter